MTLEERLRKARADINIAENAMGRALYAIDKLLEDAPEPEPPADPYAKGTKYPAPAIVSIDECEVPPGATVAHVTVRLDRETANTVHAFVRCYNGKGGRANPDATKAVTFQPGGALVQTVTFKVAQMAEGNTCLLTQANDPDGGKRGASAKITALAGAVNTPLPAMPTPAKFNPLGDLVYDATGKQVAEGGLWLDRLAHGRTQIGNAETGYYAPNNHRVEGDDLVLQSYRLPEPHLEGTPQISYPFAASTLTGLIERPGKWPVVRPELSFKYGSIEFEAKMPNRKGSWPALWLLSHQGGAPKWPFEIDLFEGFYYNNSHRPGSSLSANLHGGAEGSSQRTWTRSMFHARMRDFGLPETLDSDFHTFACTVTPETIRVFVDGLLTMEWANPFTSTDGWYPIMNVAVKAANADPYDQGSGDMTVRRVRIWRQS